MLAYVFIDYSWYGPMGDNLPRMPYSQGPRWLEIIPATYTQQACYSAVASCFTEAHPAVKDA
jgi:hypothetical protein